MEICRKSPISPSWSSQKSDFMRFLKPQRKKGVLLFSQGLRSVNMSITITLSSNISCCKTDSTDTISWTWESWKFASKESPYSASQERKGRCRDGFYQPQKASKGEFYFFPACKCNFDHGACCYCWAIGGQNTSPKSGGHTFGSYCDNRLNASHRRHHKLQVRKKMIRHLIMKKRKMCWYSTEGLIGLVD